MDPVPYGSYKGEHDDHGDANQWPQEEQDDEEEAKREQAPRLTAQLHGNGESSTARLA